MATAAARPQASAAAAGGLPQGIRLARLWSLAPLACACGAPLLGDRSPHAGRGHKEVQRFRRQGLNPGRRGSAERPSQPDKSGVRCRSPSGAQVSQVAPHPPNPSGEEREACDGLRSLRLRQDLAEQRPQVRCSIVASISACHAEDPGSIPGGGGASSTPGGVNQGRGSCGAQDVRHHLRQRDATNTPGARLDSWTAPKSDTALCATRLPKHSRERGWGGDLSLIHI